MDEQELVAIALREAERGLDVAVSRLIEAAEAISDPNALVIAAALLAQRKHTADDGRERVAFAFLTTAQRRCVDKRPGS